jgi:hypothetical protein
MKTDLTKEKQEEFRRQVEAKTKRDVEAMRGFHHTWAMQQMLMKRDWLR